MSNEIKEIQKSLNFKYGSTLKVDGDNGPYTKSAIKIAKGIMGLPKNDVVTAEFKSKLKKPGIKNPCAYESLKRSPIEKLTDSNFVIDNEKVRKILNWLRDKNRNCIFGEIFIANLFRLGWVFDISPLHCLANICIESNYGTSNIAKKYRNLVGMGITDSIQRRIYYRYLSLEASAVDWFKLISNYIKREQDTEQKLNISYKYKSDWFSFKKIRDEIPIAWRSYATSQTKSMVCGILVQELKQILNDNDDNPEGHIFLNDNEFYSNEYMIGVDVAARALRVASLPSLEVVSPVSVRPRSERPRPITMRSQGRRMGLDVPVED